jgi:hypothetical protein
MLFISYSRKSEAVAKSLVADLDQLGYKAWFDRELSGGQAWWDQILATLRDCRAVLFLLDQHSLNSSACKREFSYAADLGKPILPILVADGVSTNLLPPELSRLQFIDYRNQDRTTALSLGKALNRIPPPKPLPDPLPAPPAAPLSYLGGLTRKIDSDAPLTYEEQSALVVDLRTSLRDLGSAEDTRILLERLRSRRDLFAAIAAEVDDILDTSRQESLRPAADTPEHRRSRVVTLSERLLCALVGFAGAVALVVGAIALARDRPNSDEWPAIALIAGTAGALTGALSGRRLSAIAIALAGLALGFGLWTSIDGGYGAYVRAIVFGVSIGASLGALVGAMMRKAKRWV